MIYQYIVTLKRNNDKYIDGFNILLCTLSVLVFFFEQLIEKKFSLLVLLAAVFITAGLGRNIFLGKIKGRTVRYRYLLFIAGVIWILMPFLQWFSILFFLLSILEYQAKYPLEVGFTSQEVTINNLFKKKFPWSDFNNIILKDGLLTLDFRNNTLFQKEALEDVEGEADEEEFNDYCRKQLDASIA
jgi:hypothetical protein